ncbi:NUDIX hydrolase [Polymorphospora rubra]|uniref:NUDIX hydrolase n=1 Tax=Polymorphospora rubra TaxID=338584 RepID=UPI0033FA0ADB
MNPDLPLYERDPDAWRAYLAEGNAAQPRKRVSADVILRDPDNRLLLVDPSYKPDWDLPGGMAEANEPPHETVRRELAEELGLDLHPGPLLCIDWVAPHDPWDDLLAFVFDGGQLTRQQVAALSPRDGELVAYEFCTIEQAHRRLRPYIARRLTAALDAQNTGRVQYLVNGYPLTAS